MSRFKLQERVSRGGYIENSLVLASGSRERKQKKDARQPEFCPVPVERDSGVCLHGCLPHANSHWYSREVGEVLQVSFSASYDGVARVENKKLDLMSVPDSLCVLSFQNPSCSLQAVVIHQTCLFLLAVCLATKTGKTELGTQQRDAW